MHNRIIVRSGKRKFTEKRVEEHSKRGYVPLMEIKEDYSWDGDISYVCVMERKKPLK